MEGDAFEMEDHRNWMDASYKTYVRPLALPWPYRLAKGERTRQRVAMTLHGRPPAAAASGGSEITVSVGGPAGHTMPRVGLAVPAEHLDAALAQRGPAEGGRRRLPRLPLRSAQGARRGDPAGPWQARGGARRRAGARGRRSLPRRGRQAERRSGDPEARHGRDPRRRGADVSFPRVAVTTASDLKSTLPGSAFPPGPGWEALIAAAREAFPSAEVGGGMFSYFTELNRKRPPAEPARLRLPHRPADRARRRRHRP